MNNRMIVAMLLFIGASLFSSSVAAEPLSAEAALQKAFEHNPDLRAAANDLERADLLVVSEDGQRVPLWTSEAGYRYGNTPRLSTNGTQLTATDALTLMSQIGYTFSPGTQLSAWVEVGRSVRDTVELGDLGAAYDTSFGVQVSQPWLRGFGVDVVDAELRAAHAAKKAAAASQIATANSVAQQVLSAYWSLWSAQRSLEIATEALDVTRQQLAAGEVRLEAGVVAPSELVSLRTEVAGAEERVVEARVGVQRASLTLTRVIGVEASTALRASDADPPRVAVAPLEATISQAREQSPDLVQLRANVESASIQARVARNNALPNLETTASLQAAGLGNDLGGAFADVADFDAVIGFVGLTFELPLSNKGRRADAERAELAVRNAEIDVERAERALTTELSTLWSEANAAVERLELARQTAALARENVDAQAARFDAGKGTSLEVTDAIQRLREAEARVLDVEIELVEAQLGIGELTGSLWAAR